MKLLKSLALMSVALLGLVGPLSTHATAQDNYYVPVVIQNQTSRVLYYEFRWGCGCPSFVVLQPHTSTTHWGQLDCHGFAPTPSIRIENDDGWVRQYFLDLSTASQPFSTGKTYALYYDKDRRVNLKPI
jgi:hypothetical protein